MEQRIERKPAFTAVGYSLACATAGGANLRDIPAFWDRCHAEGKVAALEPLAGGWGILGLCADFDAGMEHFTYLIGVAAEPGKPTPAGMSALAVPTADYAVFTVVGAMPDAIQRAWGEIMGTWLPGSAYAEASPLNFELYPCFPADDPRGDPASPLCRTEIWIPVRKK